MAGVLLSLLLLLIGYYLHLSCSNTSVNRSNDEDNTTKSDDTLQGIPLNETLPTVKIHNFEPLTSNKKM